MESNPNELRRALLNTRAGTYQFPAMRKLAINSGDAFILVYSVDDPQSFDDLEQLRRTILDEREQAYLDSIDAGVSQQNQQQTAFNVCHQNHLNPPSTFSNFNSNSNSNSTSSSSSGLGLGLGLTLTANMNSSSVASQRRNQLNPFGSHGNNSSCSTHQDLSPSRHWSIASLFGGGGGHHNHHHHHQQHSSGNNNSIAANQLVQQNNSGLSLMQSNTGNHNCPSTVANSNGSSSNYYNCQGNSNNCNSFSLSSSLCSTTTNSCSSSTDNSRRSSISAAEAALKTRRTPKPPMVIVANKHDLPRDRHLVNSDEIEALAVIDWNNGFVRASAALNWNIEEIFQQVLKQARQPPTLTEAIVSKRRKSLPPKLPYT